MVTTPTSRRPHYSSIRPYPWRDGSDSVPGYAIFKGKALCLHLTEEEAIALANALLDNIEKQRANE